MLFVALSLFGCTERLSLPSGEVPVQVGFSESDDLTAKINEAVLSFYDQNEVVGVAVSVINSNEILHTSGYGWADISEELPLESSTPMLLASVSKVFIATTAVQQVEKNGLDLSTSITELVGFPVESPYTNGEITLWHALTHTSGILDSPTYAEVYAEGDPTISLYDFEKGYLIEDGEYWHRRNYSDVNAGEEYEYGNVASALAGLAIGSFAGMEFADLLQSDVLDPLGMINSSYYLRDLTEVVAIPYEASLRGFKEYPQYGLPTYPDGSMRSSADDMGRFVLSMLTDNENESILSKDAIDQMMTVDSQVPSEGQGLIWYSEERDGRVLWGHNGGDDGTMSELLLDRDAGVGVVMILNVSGDDKVADNLLDLELKLLDIAEEYSSGP